MKSTEKDLRAEDAFFARRAAPCLFGGKTMRHKINRIIAGLLSLLAVVSGGAGLLSVSAEPYAAGSVAPGDFCAIAEGIIAWKKSDVGASPDGYLLNDAYAELAGTAAGDWYTFGLGRLGKKDRSDAYLAVAEDRAEELYSRRGGPGSVKATDLNRTALAVLASGGDPTSLGRDKDGKPIDIIADGTYDRERHAPSGKQGIIGDIWGLIALDSMRYRVPEGAGRTRGDMLLGILCGQLPDGGFALGGGVADPDVTAMALQALSPYANDGQSRTYLLKSTGETAVKTVGQVIGEALLCLSALQLPTGDFASFGTANVESTDQVVVALCSLGIDPLTDLRFIKNGSTLLDGILRYRMPDGGFSHSLSGGGRSDSVAGEQTLYAMAALLRQAAGMRTLYDLRPEQSPAMKARIAGLERRITELGSEPERAALEGLLKEFYSLPVWERSYVRGYRRLSDAASAVGLDPLSIAAKTPVTESPADPPDEPAAPVFSSSDRAAADALPEKLTTADYVTVTTLLYRLTRSGDFDGRERYLGGLTDAKRRIALIREEIDDLNREIKEKLGHTEALGLGDRRAVNEMTARYMALGEYDRKKIEGSERLLGAKAELDGRLRGVVVGTVLSLVAVLAAALLVLRAKGRRQGPGGQKPDEKYED